MIDNKILIWLKTGVLFRPIIYKILISLLLIQSFLYIHSSWYLEHHDFDLLGWATSLRYKSLAKRANLEFENIVYVLRINLSNRLNQSLYQLSIVECPQTYLKVFCDSLDAPATLVCPHNLK